MVGPGGERADPEAGVDAARHRLVQAELSIGAAGSRGGGGLVGNARRARGRRGSAGRAPGSSVAGRASAGGCRQSQQEEEGKRAEPGPGSWCGSSACSRRGDCSAHRGEQASRGVRCPGCCTVVPPLRGGAVAVRTGRARVHDASLALSGPGVSEGASESGGNGAPRSRAWDRRSSGEPGWCPPPSGHLAGPLASRRGGQPCREDERCRSVLARSRFPEEQGTGWRPCRRGPCSLWWEAGWVWGAT